MTGVNERGQLPTWWRQRDQRAKEVSKIAGRRMSDRTLRRLNAATALGCPELIEAMDAETISIAAAAELADLPADLQTHILKLDPSARRELIRGLREVK